MQRTTRLKKPQVPEPGALIEFDDILGRPKYAGEEMTSETNIPSVTAEAEARAAADQELWTEIETIEAASDVVDVVGTYAELEAYDTSKLHDKDLIKVLQDETRDDAITYYRYSTTTETFAYVGAEGPYYTASETDVLLSGKQDTLVAGTNIQIASDGKTISATDTTYSDFVGATTLTNGEAGLVPAPLSTDVAKFLQGDGSWGTPTDTTYTAGTNVQISANNEISATDTTYSPFVGASASVVGAAGLVPQPAIGDQDKYLKGDGTWATVQGGGSSATKFYIDNSFGYSFYAVYKDSSYTNAATSDEVRTAMTNGGVTLVDRNDSEAYAANYYKFGSGFRLAFVWDTITRFTVEFGLGSSTTVVVKNRGFQEKLTAGTGINISAQNVISATGGANIVPVILTLDSPSSGDFTTDVTFANIISADIAQIFEGVYEYNVVGYSDGVQNTLYISADGKNIYKLDFTSSSATSGTYTKFESQEKLIAGSNISIAADGKTISATGTTYTAGTGISISAQNVISASANNINTTDWNGLWQ